MFLKKLRLINYCSFEEHLFNFYKEDGSPYKFICFFGPNGSGKTSILEAISLLTMNTTGRTQHHIVESLRKYLRSTDYDPAYESMKGFQYGGHDYTGDVGYITGKSNAASDMMIEGIYELEGSEYIVQLTNNGWIRNDFAPILYPLDTPIDEVDSDLADEHRCTGPWGRDHLAYRQRIAHFLKSDSDLSLHKFQLHYSQIESFEEVISEIMRYPADCVLPSGANKNDRGYCTDFIVTKKDHRIHFKRMSAGEKKICKSFSEILNLKADLAHPDIGDIAMSGWPRLLLIDNMVMHVYYDRHVTMVEKLKKAFNEQQIFATTHSGVLIPRCLEKKNDLDNELWVNLEPITC